MARGIYLEPLEHRGQRCLAIRGLMDTSVYQKVRRLKDIKYSRTHRCWYASYSEANIVLLKRELNADIPAVESRRSSVGDTIVPVITNLPLPPGYHDLLLERRYSEATVRTYEGQLRKFLSHIFPFRLDDVDEGQIKAYLRHLVTDQQVSISTQNTAINAIKFYFEHVQRGERKTYYIERPVKPFLLPRVLSEAELVTMIGVTTNVKHRMMILLLYSSGLRLSELLNLRMCDLDGQRMQVFVNGGKGKKDRYTVLSKLAWSYFTEHIANFSSGGYLFVGQHGGRYSARSVTRVVHMAAIRAGIAKRVTPHTLRHSFATHSLEQGVDLRYIQLLLGHESSRTTERYTHMTSKGFRGIVSPLDRLQIGGDLSNFAHNRGISDTSV